MATDKVISALDQYAWKKRQLIVISPSSEHEQYKLFIKILSEDSEELDDRNLHTWHIIDNNKVTLNSLVRDDINTQDFRETYDIRKNEFNLLLIGYDRGVKLRQKKVNINTLFSEIDQMPMRLQEMRDNNSN